MGAGKLDFLVVPPEVGPAGIEVKNVREWLYPRNRDAVSALLRKCVQLDAVPVLIARRIPYVTFKLLNPCGVILHETFNQRFPNADHELAAQASDKNLLGYHDIRLGNEPDERLTRFIHQNLPSVLPQARARFNEFKDLLTAYALAGMPYEDVSARVRRRNEGLQEDYDPELYEDEF